MGIDENVETVRRFTAALQSGDLGLAEKELAENFEVDDTDIPDSDGHDSFHTWIGRWNDAFDGWRVEDLELMPVTEDKILALFRMHARGKGSGIELSRDDATISEFRDGKISKIGYYNDQQQARAAAGLEDR